jgi:DNA-binding transcriptional regulator YiaG
MTKTGATAKKKSGGRHAAEAPKRTTWKELRDQMSPAHRARADARAAAMLAEMPLHELRQARQLSQEMLAERLRTGQAAVSKLERRADMYVSTLRGIIKAMGGDLEIVARFPDGAVKINQFRDVGDVTDVDAKA